MNISSIQYLIHPTRLLLRLDQKGIIKLKDETYLKWLFFYKLGYKLDLDNPKSFNEKIQWLKLYDHRKIYTSFADKFEAKKLVSEIIGNEYIVPTIGVWEHFDDIDFNQLPQRFVLKTTHDSGGIVVVDDIRTFDREKAKKKLETSLKKNYAKLGREWAYEGVKRRIIAEEFLSNGEEKELIDYKFMTFNGKVKCSFTCSNRFSGDGLKVTFFDMNWKEMPFERKYPKSYSSINKPLNYELMIKLSEKLAEELPFVRVDFYEVNGKVYFGEMTFYPGSGLEDFRPLLWDYELGSWIKLNLNK